MFNLIYGLNQEKQHPFLEQQKKILSETKKRLWLCLLTSFILALSGSLMIFVSADVLSEFSNAVLNKDIQTIRRGILELLLILALSSFALPALSFLNNSALLHQSIPHDDLLLKRFLDKNYLAQQSIRVSDVVSRLENDAIDFRLAWIALHKDLFIIPCILLLLGLSLWQLPWIFIIVLLLLSLLRFAFQNYREEQLALGYDAYLDYRVQANERILSALNHAVSLRIKGWLLPFTKLWQENFTNYFEAAGRRHRILEIQKEEGNELLDQFILVLILIVGALAVFLGKIEAAKVVQVIAILPLFTMLYSAIQDLFRQRKSLAPLLSRMLFFYQHEEIKKEPSPLREENQASDLKKELLIEAKNLSYTYPKSSHSKPEDEEAVDSDQDTELGENRGSGLKPISFSIHKGDFVLITGPNGSGKSTLLKILAGLLHDYEGELHFGKNCSKILCEQKAHYFPVNLEENLCLGRSLDLKNSPSDLRQLLGKWEGRLDERADKLSAASGGEAQRLSLLRCLLGSETLLILDEPINNLDQAAIDELHEILSKREQSVIMVSHDDRLNDLANVTIQLGL